VRSGNIFVLARFGHLSPSPGGACKPGLTGLWQISGRSETSDSERVTFDCAYAKNWSLGMDAKIMLGTLPAVLDSDNAY
jgi:exopolysaccharide production protein ExoY